MIEPRLLQVPGVTDITPFGGVIKQYQIEVDPVALTRYNLAIRDIAQAVDSNNQNAGGALLDNQQQGLVVRGVGLIQSIEDVENVVVTDGQRRAGVRARCRQRAHRVGAAHRHLRDRRQDRSRRGHRADAARRKPERRCWPASTKRWTSSTRPGLPSGVRIVPIYDRTDLVNNTLHTVTHTLLEGLVIVLAVLFLFLGSVRAALLTAITIPLSLLFAFICMHFSGIPANLLSLGALDFGIIVDGTLVMVEHIVHALEVRRAAGTSGDRARHDSQCGARSRAADLLLAADHRLRLHSAVHTRARRAPPVHADGVHGVLTRCSDRCCWR